MLNTNTQLCFLCLFMLTVYNFNMKLLQACGVAPADPATELTLPLTFLDIYWFKFPPAQRLFFYKIPGLDSTRFNDSVLPNLKDSLALALNHYLPLAGNLLWPPSSPKPILHYRPGDSVSLSVSESAADFDFLSGDSVRGTAESRPLAPSLFVSHARASVIALSITLFPSSGFCIGVSAHHGALDGKSTTLFIKSWAHMCKELVNGSSDPNLPPELSPVFDRTAIEENPEARGVDMAYLGQRMAAAESLSEGNPRSLAVRRGCNITNNLVSGTFELTPKNIEKLRNRVMKTEQSVSRPSTFVLSTAYVFLNIFKAKSLTSLSDENMEGEKRAAAIAFAADYRARLEPPVPANYVGNCAAGRMVEVEEREWMGGDGFARLAVKMSEAVRELEKGVLREAEDLVVKNSPLPSKYGVTGISGSTRFGVYGSDFGWGRPEKVAVQSLGAISMAESRDGSGGVEIGVVLTELQMQHFQSSFIDGLKLGFL